MKNLCSKFVAYASCLCVLLSCSQSQLGIGESGIYTSTLFGENVFVFDGSMDQGQVQQFLDDLHHQQAFNEFGNERYALLFKPGKYPLDITVDYYTQALGLGQVPGDVEVHGAVQSITTTEGTKVTTMFWRGAENFRVFRPNKEMMYWAVSQAAPMRRMHVDADINFDKHGWASGGLLANSIIEGRAGLTSGQQWFTRNSQFDHWEGGNWNRVFVGVEGKVKEMWPERPTTIIDTTPIIREKPILVFDDERKYSIFVPKLQKNTRGVSWQDDEEGEHIPLTKFHIAKPNHDNAHSINRALADGKHILFTPGIYLIEKSIKVVHPNTVLFGIGLPTLIPTDGNAAIETQDLSGIKIAGIMVDAGLKKSESLISIGEQNSQRDHSDNPISLNDVYCRVGGAIAGTAEVCVTINSHNVIVDHVWLWRADHGAGADWNINKSRNGLIVNGDDVVIYGLFNEHFQEYQTLWNGERGQTYFYQSEIPYGPPNFASWNSNGKSGFASYKVADHVKQHQAWGLGIYSFFRGEETEKNNMRLENAIECPQHENVTFTHMSIFAGLSGGINHVINGEGPKVDVGQLKTFEKYPSDRFKPDK